MFVVWQLNELLVPNPFARPRHVFMLEVPLAEGFIQPMTCCLSGISYGP